MIKKEKKQIPTKNYKKNIVRKIYSEKDIENTQSQIKMLGDKSKLDVISFMNIRFISTIILFVIILYQFKIGYIIAPIFAVVYYYLYYYIFITIPLNIRIKKLDHEALYFFEILTFTLESGRNLENSLEVTCFNVDSEISDEFKKALFEMKFGNSLLESLENMKTRIPSEAINNILLNITQTDVFGSSIIDTMYSQVDFLREKQILEIKGQINKIPNKISIVSVVFIVPLILAMILGPFLIDFLS